MEDRELVRRVKAGDRQAMEILLGRYEKGLYRMAVSIVMEREAALDVVAEAFTRAFRRIRSLRDPSRFKEWLFRIGANLARDELRRRSRIRPIEEAGEAAGGPDPAREAARRELALKVKEALEALPNRQREVVALRAFEGLGFREIARLFGISEGAARANYHFGVRALRRALKGEG